MYFSLLPTRWSRPNQSSHNSASHKEDANAPRAVVMASPKVARKLQMPHYLQESPRVGQRSVNKELGPVSLDQRQRDSVASEGL